MMPAFEPESSGVRAWHTRRRGLYLNAVNSLHRLDLGHLILAFATITEFIAPLVPEGTVCEPYRMVKNGEGEPSFALPDGMLLNPGIPDPLPSEEAAMQFARDLRGEWFDRLATTVGLAERTGFLEAKR